MDGTDVEQSEGNSMHDAVYGGERAQYKGVYKCGKKFKAQIQIERVQHYLGLFDSEIEAAVAYDNHARIILGARARTNFAYNAQPLPLDASSVAPIVFTNVSSSSSTAKKKRGYAGLNSRIQFATEHIPEPAVKNARWERNELPRLGYQSSYTLSNPLASNPNPAPYPSIVTTDHTYGGSGGGGGAPKDQLSMLQSLYPPSPKASARTTASHSRPTGCSIIEGEEARRSPPAMPKPASPLHQLAEAAADAASEQDYLPPGTPTPVRAHTHNNINTGASAAARTAEVARDHAPSPAHHTHMHTTHTGHHSAPPHATTAAAQQGYSGPPYSASAPPPPPSMAALLAHEQYLQYLRMYGAPPLPPAYSTSAAPGPGPSQGMGAGVGGGKGQPLHRPQAATFAPAPAPPHAPTLAPTSTSTRPVPTVAVRGGAGGAASAARASAFAPAAPPPPPPLPRPATYWAGVLYADPVNRTQVWKGSFVMCADASIKPQPAEFATSRNLFEYTTAGGAEGGAGGGVSVVRLPVSGHMIGGYSEVDARGQVRTFEDADFVIHFQPVADSGSRVPQQFAVYGRGVGQCGAYTIAGSYSALSGVLEMSRIYLR